MFLADFAIKLRYAVKKKIVIFQALLGILCLLSASNATAQFRNSAAPKLNTLEQMRSEDEGSGFLSGLLDPARFSMHQAYSFSYTTGPTGSAGLSVFTNTFSYRVNPDMQISADVSAVYSPFSSFGDKFSKSINGVYLSNARLDWKLGEQTFLTVAYSRGPLSGYSSPFGGSSFFNDSFDERNAYSPFRTSTIRVDH